MMRAMSFSEVFRVDYADGRLLSGSIIVSIVTELGSARHLMVVVSHPS